MTNQPVPDNMVLIDGKLVKKAELSRQQKLENVVIYPYVTFVYFLQSIVWYWKLALIQWRKRRQLPSALIVLELFGAHPQAAIDVLRGYGVYAQGGSIKWAIVWNTVNLRLPILVAASQWEFADNILFQTESDDYLIVSNPGAKRGQSLPRPYVQRQPSQQAQRPSQSARRPVAKLGQRYR